MSATPNSTKAKANAAGAFAFQIFCASIFLGIIGLVFFNAVLRYCFNSGYPPWRSRARAEMESRMAMMLTALRQLPSSISTTSSTAMCFLR